MVGERGLTRCPDCACRGLSVGGLWDDTAGYPTSDGVSSYIKRRIILHQTASDVVPLRSGSTSGRWGRVTVRQSDGVWNGEWGIDKGQFMGDGRVVLSVFCCVSFLVYSSFSFCQRAAHSSSIRYHSVPNLRMRGSFRKR